MADPGRRPTSWSTASTRSISSGSASWNAPHVRFRDSDHLVRIIQRIAARVGRRIDETSPMVDARLRRRQPRERHVPAGDARRADAFHSPLRPTPIAARRPAAAGDVLARNRHVPSS